MKILISDILIDNSNNVSREPLSAEECQTLATAIDNHGQIGPVLVTPIDHPDFKYKLVCGYKRMFAMGSILGYNEVEAYIREGISDEHGRILNVTENLEREDLSYWQQCKALNRAFHADRTETEISKALSRSRSWVRARWLVWRLPEEILAQVEEGLLTATDVGLLIQQTPEEQIAAAARLRAGKEAGETTNSMLGQFSRRKSIRSKKEIQSMMTDLLGQERHNEMHALRFALGEINDSQLFELLS